MARTPQTLASMAFDCAYGRRLKVHAPPRYARINNLRSRKSINKVFLGLCADPNGIELVEIFEKKQTFYDFVNYRELASAAAVHGNIPMLRYALWHPFHAFHYFYPYVNDRSSSLLNYLGILDQATLARVLLVYIQFINEKYTHSLPNSCFPITHAHWLMVGPKNMAYVLRRILFHTRQVMQEYQFAISHFEPKDYLHKLVKYCSQTNNTDYCQVIWEHCHYFPSLPRLVFKYFIFYGNMCHIKYLLKKLKPERIFIGWAQSRECLELFGKLAFTTELQTVNALRLCAPLATPDELNNVIKYRSTLYKPRHLLILAQNGASCYKYMFQHLRRFILDSHHYSFIAAVLKLCLPKCRPSRALKTLLLFQADPRIIKVIIRYSPKVALKAFLIKGLQSREIQDKTLIHLEKVLGFDQVAEEVKKAPESLYVKIWKFQRLRVPFLTPNALNSCFTLPRTLRLIDVEFICNNENPAVIRQLIRTICHSGDIHIDKKERMLALLATLGAFKHLEYNDAGRVLGRQNLYPNYRYLTDELSDEQKILILKQAAEAAHIGVLRILGPKYKNVDISINSATDPIIPVEWYDQWDYVQKLNLVR